ncbi:MAG TPA: hypothetical protein VM010_01595 [Chitinophagaceae bacterium]|nr:hypothetical protein [Chitinophagaceae bacterium]
MNQKQTKTGDLVQVSECKENGVTYGRLAITLKRQFQNRTVA